MASPRDRLFPQRWAFSGNRRRRYAMEKLHRNVRSPKSRRFPGEFHLSPVMYVGSELVTAGDVLLMVRC